MTDPADVTTHAVLAIEAALSDADRQRILGKFSHTGLNGAPVADILDILDNSDALLELREPFYDDGGADEARRQLGWPLPEDHDPLDTYLTNLQARLVGFAALAVALLTDAVPTPGPVARLAARAAEVAESRWPGGEYVVQANGNGS